MAHDPGAREHFERKLQYEIDPSDAYELSQSPGAKVVIVDARPPEVYEQRHAAGAINLPHRTMSVESTASLDRDALYIVYCDGIGCNASTKGARNLASLGFQVKEMIGGMEWWLRDGFPVHGASEQPARTGAMACACG